MVHQLAKPWRSDFEMVNPCGSQWCSNHAKVSLNFPWVSCAHGSIAFCCSFSCFRTAVHQGMLVDRVEWLQPFMIAKSWRGVAIPDSPKITLLTFRAEILSNQKWSQNSGMSNQCFLLNIFEHNATKESWKEDVWIHLLGLFIGDELQDSITHNIQIGRKILFLTWNGMMNDDSDQLQRQLAKQKKRNYQRSQLYHQHLQIVSSPIALLFRIRKALPFSWNLLLSPWFIPWHFLESISDLSLTIQDPMYLLAKYHFFTIAFKAPIAAANASSSSSARAEGNSAGNANGKAGTTSKPQNTRIPPRWNNKKNVNGISPSLFVSFWLFLSVLFVLHVWLKRRSQQNMTITSKVYHCCPWGALHVPADEQLKSFFLYKYGVTIAVRTGRGLLTLWSNLCQIVENHQ